MSRLRRAGFSPKIIQQIIQGIATRSIRMPQGVANRGTRICRITASGASKVAPASFTVGLSRFMINLPMACFHILNLYNSNYPKTSILLVF